MKEESSLLLLRAEEAIESADLLLVEGYLADSTQPRDFNPHP